MVIVVYMPINFEEQHIGWEGRYIVGETAQVLCALVREMPDQPQIVRSGFLLNEYPQLNAFWSSAHDTIVEWRVKEQAARELREAREQAKEIRGRVLDVDVLSPP